VDEIVGDHASGNPYEHAKRLIDLLIALLLLLPGVLLCLIGAAAIFAESRCNPILNQTRVGRHLQPFRLYKLRTMRLDTAHVASHLAPSSQITRVGGLLRRLKIDELPQLICVLRGDMSLVGPRPCLPAQTELVEERSRRGVYTARPGITGLAQVNGIDMSTPVELAIADAEYVHNMHLALDLRLLARTVIGHGMGDAIRP
jgi:lipopolysaccharide/colanic/teichoic acid biosynthesis glycosyltransferase